MVPCQAADFPGFAVRERYPRISITPGGLAGCDVTATASAYEAGISGIYRRGRWIWPPVLANLRTFSGKVCIDGHFPDDHIMIPGFRHGIAAGYDIFMASARMPTMHR